LPEISLCCDKYSALTEVSIVFVVQQLFLTDALCENECL